ncbi:hypothetical protein JQ557_11950 [Bradyrhizobium sp. U87765 SZCCT0131]|uniref:hypothetical protein n=1 Tax=unclassified Bradyrhizobium TaxID=2631580 RepID=UPI001BACEED5|nr:hypothetical protein [Bradyrhizobium sp. U87765 SZCCT0131]MBR1265535.1 hypothetical protein [Bradyrhizobium sp. U87765 SZCCT0134]MBR1304205.1 hypothetical protein [Bradyrhizobium sp. U87765 SZCCT0110]MBR1319810.1 hypothetical protein [Bradyrhizobium sp. U87765 SZCCT0109]MBR1348136.1 hypothetical protein [Bradyrhizobium sp. U87765 SZCCT0048]
MTNIDRKQAAEALSDIEAIAHRVRQSQFYRTSSLLLVMWGVLVAIGYVVAYVRPHGAGYGWLAVYVLGIAGSFVVSAFEYTRSRVRAFDGRMFAAFLLFVGFGLLWTLGLAHFTPRQLSAFWPTYFMLAYGIAGLWIGPAFVGIALSIISLTLVGYVWSGPWFDLWMAFVNGGGLILGGLWMRRD